MSLIRDDRVRRAYCEALGEYGACASASCSIAPQELGDRMRRKLGLPGRMVVVDPVPDFAPRGPRDEPPRLGWLPGLLREIEAEVGP